MIAYVDIRNRDGKLVRYYFNVAEDVQIQNVKKTNFLDPLYWIIPAQSSSSDMRIDKLDELAAKSFAISEEAPKYHSKLEVLYAFAVSIVSMGAIFSIAMAFMLSLFALNPVTCGIVGGAVAIGAVCLGLAFMASFFVYKYREKKELKKAECSDSFQDESKKISKEDFEKLLEDVSTQQKDMACIHEQEEKVVMSETTRVISSCKINGLRASDFRVRDEIYVAEGALQTVRKASASLRS